MWGTSLPVRHGFGASYYPDVTSLSAAAPRLGDTVTVTGYDELTDLYMKDLISARQVEIATRRVQFFGSATVTLLGNAASEAALSLEKGIIRLTGQEIRKPDSWFVQQPGHWYVAGVFENLQDPHFQLEMMLFAILSGVGASEALVGPQAVAFEEPVGLLDEAAAAQFNASKGARHYTDFADEAAEIMENAGRSRGLNPNQNVFSMAMSRKDALKRMHSLVPRVEEHINKLMKNPTSVDARHWRTELRAWLDTMEKAAPHTREATSEEWLFKIRIWRLLTDASQ